MTISWAELPLWQVQRLANIYAVKVNNTAVVASVQGTYQDHNLKVDVYGTDSNRMIGYVLRERKAGRKPRHLVGDFYLGLFYTDLRDLEKPETRKPIEVLYHDSNVRILSFGSDKKIRDYLMVLRRQEKEVS